MSALVDTPSKEEIKRREQKKAERSLKMAASSASEDDHKQSSATKDKHKQKRVTFEDDKKKFEPADSGSERELIDTSTNKYG